MTSIRKLINIITESEMAPVAPALDAATPVQNTEPQAASPKYALQQITKWKNEHKGFVASKTSIATMVTTADNWLRGTAVFIVISVKQSAQEGCIDIAVDRYLAFNDNGKMKGTPASLHDGKSFPRSSDANPALAFADHLKAVQDKQVEVNNAVATLKQQSPTA